MKNTKAVVDFTDYKAAELGPIAEVIGEKLAANAGTFPALPVSLAALQGLITDYKEKLVARASRATADVLAWQAAREKLEAALGALGHYVNLVAMGDAAIVEQ